jgi:hypothetical protein
MFKGLLGLVVLLVEQVVENILVPLDEPLRILLPVLELFVPVPLNSLEKSCKGQLLGMPQFRFLFLKHRLHLAFKFGTLKLL